MKKLMILALAVGVAGCGDFVDEDGQASIRQFAEGLRTLGDRIAEMAEAIDRDADVRAVPWQDLARALPERVDGAERRTVEGDQATDRNGAGLSIVHATYGEPGDSVYLGIADLGALRSGVALALRWVAPLFHEGEIDGEIEEIEVGGYPGIRITDEGDDGVLMLLLVEGRFAVAGIAERSGDAAWVETALGAVDHRRLEGWGEYGR